MLNNFVYNFMLSFVHYLYISLTFSLFCGKIKGTKKIAYIFYSLQRGDENMYVGRFHKYKIAAICISSIHEESLAHTTRSISDALVEKGYKVLIFSAFTDFYTVSPSTEGDISIFSLINHELIDVLIVLPETIKNPQITGEIIATAQKHGTPVITIDGAYDGAINLLYDYEQGFEMMCRHVIEHHDCKDIFLMAGMRDNKFSDDRIAVYKKVLAENGIPFREEGRFDYGDFWNNPTREAMERFFEGGYPMPEAFVCINDSMAISVTKALGERGYNVPQDVIVTGFDATYQAAVHSLTDTSSAILDTEHLAGIIAEISDRVLAGEEIEKKIRVKYKEQFAHSCGCVALRESFVSDRLLKMDHFNSMQLNNETKMAQYYANSVEKRSYDEMIREMVKYIDDYSGICINSDYVSHITRKEEDSYNKHFHREMKAICQKNLETNVFDVTFPTEKLIPEFGKAIKRFDRILFSPLSFQENVIGYYYTVVDYNEYSFRDAKRLTTFTNQILENYKNTCRLKEAYDHLAMTYCIDPLTELYNRKGYFTAMEHERKERFTAPYIMMLSIDMDKLKYINDTFGHAEGDKAIVEVAEAIRSVAKDKGVCARFGGDEFILTLPCSDDKREPAKIVGELRTHLDIYNNKNSDCGYEVSISVGYKTVKNDEKLNIEELITATDQLMYKQKRSKKTIYDGRQTVIEPVAQNPFEAKIHEIFSARNNATYFYLNYLTSEWYIMDTENTPPCLRSETVGPLRAMWLSGSIYEDDIQVFEELSLKIRKAYNEKLTEQLLQVALRLTDTGTPLWYNLTIVMIPDEDEKLKELAGMLTLATSEDIMLMELRNYYTTTENPLMITEAFSYKISANKDKKYAFIQFDIKRFKLINENYGEDAGTELLHSLARQLRTYCNPYQVSARVNGDIFTLLTPYETKEDIYEITSTLQERLKGFRGIKYEFAFGVYLIEDVTEPVRIMEDRAAVARVSIKNNAIENVAFYDDKMQESLENKRFVENNMKTALENEEFIIYLQPKFSISTEAIVGYEALVRWNHPELGLIPPFKFIPIFEENGFVSKLDYHVWECACSVLGDWKERGFKMLPISVNVSRVHLNSDSFLDFLDSLVEKYGIEKKYIELEITESVEGEHITRMTTLAKSRGYTLLMDDFGSGYSSLNTLKSTRFDVLKIDREFLSSFINDERGKKIISHTISMSKDVGLGLIAEGVETLEQAKFLQECGCDVAQGYYYAKPMPVQEAESYLEIIKTPKKKK